MSAGAIDEIKERLHDLSDALREAGHVDVAANLEGYALDFGAQTRVRRSVNAIRAQLEAWREDPSQVPDTPKVTLAANRLEDVCRSALAAGVIVAAPPTRTAQWRRKAFLVFWTLLCATVVASIPVVLIRAGFDLSDLRTARKLGPIRLPRGEEASLSITVLSEARAPEAVTGVEFGPKSNCNEALSIDASCAQAAPRLWAEGRLPTYELKLRHQAYGLLFAVADAKVHDRRVGEGRLLLAATDDTPEGHYEIPLAGAFLGYSQASCELLDRVLGNCAPPRKGERERDVGLAVPLVVVDVLPGDPSRRLGEKRRAQAEAEEARRQAEERAQQIEGVLSEIDAALTESKGLIARRQWPLAAERVRRLARLFQPVDSLMATPTEAAAMPAEVGAVRARFEALRDQLEAFETRLFEQTFTVLTAEANRRAAEDSLLQRVATQFGVPREYVQSVYTARADEIQRRLDLKAQARVEQLKAEQTAREKRCGTLPKDAWQTVDRYVQQGFRERHVEISLGECMTPRLTATDCWEMRCNYTRKEEITVERPKVVTRHEASFFLSHDRVTHHTR